MYNIWCKWQPLKTVMLGSLYDVSFYDNIKNKRIKDALVKITEESQIELDYFEKVLKDFGCDVIRPILNKKMRIEQYSKNGEITGVIPRPPLQPRDAQLVIGDTLYYTNKDHPSISKALYEYNPHAEILHTGAKDRNTWAPMITVVGKDVYYDSYVHENIKKNNINLLKNNEMLENVKTRLNMQTS